MKLKLIIEADVPDDIAAQVKRSGCTVSRSGSYMRLKVGSNLIARDQATITLTSEDRKHAHPKE